jgi:hypothetical protein
MAVSALTDDAIALDRAGLGQGDADALLRPEPALQKTPARRWKEATIIRRHRWNEVRPDVGEAPIGGRIEPRHAAVPDIAVRKRKARARIIGLLPNNAVETHRRAVESRHPGAPEAQTVSPATELRPHDIKAKKRESSRVPNDRNARDRFASPKGHEEPFGIGRVEAASVREPGVPPFGGGPFDREVEIRARHRPDLEALSL